MPQELFPIMPPSEHRLWVEGSGPNVSLCSSARARRVSSTTPGCTRANPSRGFSSRIWFMYLVKSSTTATLQLCPARLVPAPRGSTGAPYFRHAATAAITSSAVARHHEPIGTCR